MEEETTAAVVWEGSSRTLVSLDIELGMGHTHCNISARYRLEYLKYLIISTYLHGTRSSCSERMTLWSVSVCPAVFREEDTAGDGDREEVDDDDTAGAGDHEEVYEDDEDEDEDGCRHITIHPDTLKTTAIVEGLLPCTQYLIR